MNLCQYKDIFGKVDEGVHKYKIFGISVVDTLATLLVSVIISILFKFNFLLVFIILFLIGEYLHCIFCVDTAVIKFTKNL